MILMMCRYGMDMTQYAAKVGMFLWTVVGKELAPFPETTVPFGHYKDLCNGPFVTAV